MPVIRDKRPIQLVQIDNASDWDHVKRLAGDSLLPQDLDGLMLLLNGFVRAVYIEHDYIDATASLFDSFAFLSIHYPDLLILSDRHSI